MRFDEDTEEIVRDMETAGLGTVRMLKTMFTALGEEEICKECATYAKNQFDAFMAVGFTCDEAMQLVTAGLSRFAK